jgi:site-specific recombinase XerD
MQRLYLEHRESARTRDIRLTAVRQFFAWRERCGLGLSPARMVKGPKKPKPEPRKYSMPQLRAMFVTLNREKAQGIRDYAILLFFLATGARREEVAEINLTQLALQQRVGMVKLSGKGAKERTLSFEGEAVSALLEWLAVRDSMDVIDTEAVFLGMTGPSKGRRLNKSGLHGVIARAQKIAKLKLPEGSALHMLRSTYATRLYDECGDIEVVRIAMGHDDINTTRRYIAISDRQLRTRISSDFLTDITGGKRHGTPLWAKHQLHKPVA